MTIDRDRTERIRLLREAYGECPVQKNADLGFWISRRQKYLFVKGWKETHVTNSLLRRSMAYANVLQNMRPVILEQELIVGQPDFAPLEGEERKEWEVLSVFADMIPFDGGRTDHKSLDFEKLVHVGVEGLLQEIGKQKETLDLNQKEDIEKYNFYQCAEVELKGLLALAQHYSDYAAELAQAAEENRKEELQEISRILKIVPRYPAGSFREALQSIHFYTFCLWGLYQCGHPDRYLLPFYEKDIQKGVLTREQAQELIDCFCLMYTVYANSDSSIGFMVGGRDAAGKNVENELTHMFIKSIAHTKTADPSIGLCVTNETSEELLQYACRLLAEGYSHPAIYNDEKITESFLEYGVKEQDAHCYIHSCCVELTIDKKSDVWVVSPYHNTLQYLLDVMKQQKNCITLEELLQAYAVYLRKQIVEKNLEQNLWQLERSHNAGEPVLVSCLIDDCIKKGKGIHAGGAVYNWTQPNFIGIANTVESLLTLEKYVFVEKVLSLEEMNHILESNFEGQEEFRKRILREGPRFGVGDDHADSLYHRITEMILEGCKGIYNYRGDILIPASFSYNEHIRYGGNTQASADGRFAKEPLADGSNPVQGRDNQGPTAMIHSVTAWKQEKFLGGTATNLRIQKGNDPEKTAEVLLALIRTFLQKGGIEIQVNALDSEELKDAMLHPERHGDLLVRIGGYSDYFVTLSEKLQKEILSRSENQLG